MAQWSTALLIVLLSADFFLLVLFLYSNVPLNYSRLLWLNSFSFNVLLLSSRFQQGPGQTLHSVSFNQLRWFSSSARVRSPSKSFLWKLSLNHNNLFELVQLNAISSETQTKGWSRTIYYWNVFPELMGEFKSRYMFLVGNILTTW